MENRSSRKKDRIKRDEIIATVLAETGLTKKQHVMAHIRNHAEYAPFFKKLSRRRFSEIIVFDPDQEVLDVGHRIKGRSVLKNSRGEVVMEWVKTSKDNDLYLEALTTAAKALTEEIKPVDPVKLSKSPRKSKLCNQYTLTDYHLGMMSWGEETGGNWDMKIAENMLVAWFEESIASSPNAEQAIFAQIGDFLHWDGMDAVTPASKHVLDADTRFNKLVRVAIRVIRRVIDMLLNKYSQVHIIMAEGNHDPASSVWLREMLNAFYDNEPRVSVDTNPDPYYHFQWGKCALFYHHGHKRNANNLDAVLVSKFKGPYGSSDYIYAHTGHLHHQKQLETLLMIVEQHQTLAAKDAYASRGGWASGRSSSVISYHKDFGEVGRSRVSPEMLK
jgi:hypothetical protein